MGLRRRLVFSRKREVLRKSEVVRNDRKLLEDACQKISELSEKRELAISTQEEQSIDTEFATLLSEIALPSHLLHLFMQKVDAYEAAAKEKLCRQVCIVAPDTSQAHIDLLFQRYHGAGPLLEYAVLHQNNPVSTLLYHVQTKHQTVLSLERQIKDLHQLLIGLHNVLQQQEEHIDSIQDHLALGSSDISSGLNMLDDAVNLDAQGPKQCRKRSALCFLSSSTAAALAILLIVLL